MGDNVVLSVPNADHGRYLKTFYAHLIQETIREVCDDGQEVSVVFAHPEPVPAQAAFRSAAPGRRPTTRRLAAADPKGGPENPGVETLFAALVEEGAVAGRQGSCEYTGMPLSTRYTFDNFVVGAGNQFAHAASLSVAEHPAGRYNPLFIYGGSGLGKTHLLHAIGHVVASRAAVGGGEVRLCYVPSQRFMEEMIESITNQQVTGFRERYRKVDLLMIDDVHGLAGKERTQEEFFHTFNTLYDAHKQIVLTSDRLPKDIKTLEHRLRSRFECGLIVDIQPPDLETKVAIIRKKAASLKVKVPDDAALFIAERVTSSVRELEGCLNRVAAQAAFRGNRITVPFVREVLRDILNEPEARVTTELVIDRVAEYFSLKSRDLRARGRTKPVAEARQIAMYLARELTNDSTTEIGSKFGGRDHSTVIFACKKIEDLDKQDEVIAKTLRRLRTELGKGSSAGG